jgi:tRNA threonylcarbamoyl adenosine modification protein (Sua5/YciO/YrdC/YwlC family)
MCGGRERFPLLAGPGGYNPCVVQRITVYGGKVARDAIAKAVAVLHRGGVVAFPTETVYGICVNAADPAAVNRLYAAKGRQASRACAFLLAERESASALVPELPALAHRLAEAFWPGPLTLIVPHAGTSVGLRLPAHGLARALAAEAGSPLLQSSANRSGEPAALNAAGVEAALGDAVDLLLDGGRTMGGRSSTVVRCDNETFAILRKGAIPEAEVIRAATDLTLVVCTGNLCRSPLAEAMLRRALAERLECAERDLTGRGHRLGSFGTIALAGHPASLNAITVGEEYGLDLRAHRSRPFALSMIRDARRVYGLTRGHCDFLQPYFRQRPDDLDLIDPKGREIQDPYGLSLKAYRRVGAQIGKAVDLRAAELVPDKDDADAA